MVERNEDDEEDDEMVDDEMVDDEGNGNMVEKCITNKKETNLISWLIIKEKEEEGGDFVICNMKWW